MICNDDNIQIKYYKIREVYLEWKNKFEMIVSETLTRDSFWREEQLEHINKIVKKNFESDIPKHEISKQQYCFEGLLRFKILDWVMVQAELDNQMGLQGLKNIKNIQ